MPTPEATRAEVRRGNIAPTKKRCVMCGVEFATRWARQKYCSPCGGKARGVMAERSGASLRAAKSGALEEIHATLGRQETHLLDILEKDPPIWSVIFSVPYSLAVSKNRRWSMNGKGTVFLTQSARVYSDAVALATKAALRGQRIAQNKLWLSFFVEKENHKSDAVNVVDTLCDAIKVAVGLDDRWFCIERVDWAIKKRDPRIIIKISQTSDEDVIACSHCGELLTAEFFSKRANGPLGRYRICKSCQSVVTRHAKAKRKRGPASKEEAL